MTDAPEIRESFDCFGSSCTVVVSGDTRLRSAEEVAGCARRRLLGWHESFSRFRPTSELSRLNSDPRRQVSVSPLMAQLAEALITAATLTDGLVDATLLEEIETAGYSGELSPPLALQTALELAPARRAAGPSARGAWREIEVDLTTNTITRPPGVKLDSGGLAKGLFADVLAVALAGHQAFAVNCGGDIAIGGSSGLQRPVEVESPFDGRTLHTFELSQGGVATSGIGRRSWLDANSRPAHHLLDPASGTPAFTGVVQVTALAPSALLAEIHAKAAILSGPRRAAAWLPHGGVIVLDDGSHRVIEPPRVISLSDLSAFTKPRATVPAHDL